MSAKPSPPEKLLDMARAIATERQWPWLEPIDIDLVSTSTSGRVWRVRTNCHARGQNIEIQLREPDFTLVKAAFLPR